MAQDIYSKLTDDFYNLEKEGYEVLGVFVQGSQNYDLDYENSDIDTKAIVLPSFYDLCNEIKPVSYTKVNKDDSHCDVKDIREMFKIFKKQNVNYLEILFTKYQLINPFYESIFRRLVNFREEIARYNEIGAVKSIAGMSLQKLEALEHPYPIWKEHIEKYGYSNKQLHHILRLNDFIKRYISGEPFLTCLIANDREKLIDIKKNPTYYSLEEARILANETHQDTWRIKEEFMSAHHNILNKEVEKFLSDILTSILQKYYKNVFMKG